jgi:epoxyqueuosine reductase
MPGLNEEITKYLTASGAALAGFAGLSVLEEDACDGFPRAVVIAIALKPEVIAGITLGPTPPYYAEYKQVNGLLDRLAAQTAQFLEQRGFKAKVRPATFEEDKAHLAAKLPHKTAATLAGLGWVGKNGLLVTEKYGPAVRLATVLTDAPVTTGQPVIKSLCRRCKSCIEACPARALTGKDWEPGRERETLVDAYACREMARKLTQRLLGEAVSICGLCITACPYTRKYLKKATGTP